MRVKSGIMNRYGGTEVLWDLGWECCLGVGLEELGMWSRVGTVSWDLVFITELAATLITILYFQALQT